MKSTYLVFVILFSVIPLSAQILNSSFENWAGGEPIAWYTSNNTEIAPGLINVYQTTNAHEGMFAVRGESAEYELGGSTYILGPRLSNYDIFSAGSEGFPINDRPINFRGYFIYEPVSNSEYLSISVYLTKWIGNGSDRILVGNGGKTIHNTFFLDSVYTEFVAPINYLSQDQPDTILISISISTNEVGSVFYIDDLSLDVLEIQSPAENEILIAGEQDTIVWSASCENINLSYSTDDGVSFTNLLTNYPADIGEYAWDIPEELLSAKSVLRIENSDDVSQKFDQPVRIKPYIITKLDQNGDYVAYDVNKDQWGFSNIQSDMWPLAWYGQFKYQGVDPFTGLQYSQRQASSTFSIADSSRHTDWVSWVNAFGTDAFYRSIFLGLYRTSAVLKWRSTWGNWGGSCFGIAASNALAFAYRDQFFQKYPNYFSFTNPITVVSDTGVKRVINELFTHQFGNPSLANDALNNGKTPTQTLNDLKSLFKTDNTPIKTLTIFNNGGSGGHTILAYKLKQDPNQDSVYYVNVYDNSNPNSSNPITINTAANGGQGSWNTPDWSGWGGATGMYLEIVSSQYLFGANLQKNQNNPVPFRLPNDVVEIDYPLNSNIKITDFQGNITGFINNQVYSEISGSLPRIIKDGSETPPYGYILQSDNYSVLLDEFDSDTVEAFFFTGNKSFVYERTAATQTQLDRLFFDGSLSVSNPDQEPKTISLLNLVDESDQEKLSIVRSLELVQNDSVRIENPDSNKIRLISYGSAKTYDIELNYVTDIGIGRFGDFNVNLNANSSHTLVPEWTELNTSEVQVLIDLGNDGTIDDTLYLQNQVTGIGDDQGSLLSPNSFNLAQNFPNPFNPVTTIQYSIPQRSNVVIKVYDILGNEVANLVNEEKDKGVYSVAFNAAGLASGIYLYTLRAGSFVQTKKMLLIK